MIFTRKSSSQAAALRFRRKHEFCVSDCPVLYSPSELRLGDIRYSSYHLVSYQISSWWHWWLWWRL